MTDDDHLNGPPEPPGPARPKTPQDWRDLLRNEPLPEEHTELPYRQRRRARRRWRSAQRATRSQWIRQERRRTPTGIHIPLIALLLATAVAVAAWLWPAHAHRQAARHAPAAPTSATATATTPSPPTSADTPTATGQPIAPPAAGPADIARDFFTAYTTRLPVADVTHLGAVRRAAPYASQALVDNLARHDDHDFNVLAARQATAARPADVRITAPTNSQRPAPDTPVRVWLQATATINVTGTHDYNYQRSLTLEVSRADVGTAWMVTRVLGIQD